MTDRDRKLIEDNMKLIYWCCNKFGIIDEDEIQDVILKCCKSIPLFDESKGKISTYIYTIVFHAKLNLNNAKHRCKVIPDYLKISINDSIVGKKSSTSDGENLKVEDIIYDRKSLTPFEVIEYNFELNECIQYYKQYFPKNCDRDLEIFIRYMNDEPRENIEKYFNLSRVSVFNVIKRIKLFIKNYQDGKRFENYRCAQATYDKYYPLIKTKTIRMEEGRLICEKFSS